MIIKGFASKELELKKISNLSFIRINRRVCFKCTFFGPTSRKVNLIEPTDHSEMHWTRPSAYTNHKGKPELPMTQQYPQSMHLRTSFSTVTLKALIFQHNKPLTSTL